MEKSRLLLYYIDRIESTALGVNSAQNSIEDLEHKSAPLVSKPGFCGIRFNLVLEAILGVRISFSTSRAKTYPRCH